jgi:acetolactate synthase-1/2/3 large subunit
MSKQPSKNTDTTRRDFLMGATVASTAAALTPVLATAAPTPAGNEGPRGAPPPDRAAELPPPEEGGDPVVLSSSGGDFMVDVLKSLDIEYLATMCASTFRGLHESIINYGGNSQPEILTCPHEEITVSMAQGYAKIAGKPMAAICHGTVGLQHASMALYNAWCDRVPIYVLIGNIASANRRLYDFEWQHSALDAAGPVRDFLKWDDQPANLQHFAESAVRAYKVAITPPMGPVLLSLDQFLQEDPIRDRASLQIPRLTRLTPPTGDPAALDELARMLVAAEYPLLICGRVARTPATMERLVELAETLQCAVLDTGRRMNFPSHHPLAGGKAAQADLIVGIEVDSVFNATHALRDRIERATPSTIRPGTKFVTLGCSDLYLKANYQDFQRYEGVDLAIAGDGEDSLPLLIELVKKRIGAGGGQTQREARGKKLAQEHNDALERAREQATIGWDASPITPARLCAELYAQISDLDWSLVASDGLSWPRRLWNFDRPYRWNGGSGGSGIGYMAPAAAGAALANKPHGRLSVCIQTDGDLMFVPSTLWTAAHHRIPILYVMHNNRAYHQEYMYLQAMADRRQRGIDKAHIGTTLIDPNVDFATVARGYGVHGEGPITDPKQLAPALARALAVVRRGEPALVDVVTDPR